MSGKDSMRIDLLLLGNSADFDWPLGDTLYAERSVAAIAGALQNPGRQEEHACLIWDPALGAPDPGTVEKIAGQPGDVWHAGLRLGLGGLPRAIDFTDPVWMLNADAAPDADATSWRLSLRCCLLSPEYARRAPAALASGFQSLEAAGLELGHRWIKGGALIRHIPALAGPALPPQGSPRLSLRDEMLFLARRYGPRWTAYAAFRMMGSGYASPGAILQAWAAVKGTPCIEDRVEMSCWRPRQQARGSVTVLIPTIDRYPYLETLLPQLQAQTIPAAEIVIIDQTPAARRRSLSLPGGPSRIRVMRLEENGQCISRNAGLLESNGDFILFLDDDDEVAPDLIESHLASLGAYGADVSAGVADEVDAGPLPEHFRFLRTSDVFPTNNAMVRRRTLERSGLFDLAYNKGQRADGDLGMRAYLSGAIMVLNPAISVLHHHAPQGGLRVHKARKITYASSRASLWQRQLPSVTEVYLMHRYYTAAQIREALWHRALSTLSASGGALRRFTKALIAGLLLPHTLWHIRKMCAQERSLRNQFPKIPALPARVPVLK